jgi:hypothetical protein
MRSWLVLCGVGDRSALWAFQGLRRYVPHVELVTADVLACSLRWQHRIGGGRTSTAIQLADGRLIAHDTLDGVINRLTSVPSAAFKGASTRDRQYAEEEVLALWSSWLYSLPCAVMNRPSGQYPSPGWFAQSEWVWLAMSAGLLCPLHVESSRGGDGRHAEASPAHTVFVVGDTVAPTSVPGYVRDGSIALAKAAQLSIVSLGFSERADGAWEFQSASAFPDLMLGGDELLRAIGDS